MELANYTNKNLNVLFAVLTFVSYILCGCMVDLVLADKRITKRSLVRIVVVNFAAALIVATMVFCIPSYGIAIGFFIVGIGSERSKAAAYGELHQRESRVMLVFNAVLPWISIIVSVGLVTLLQFMASID